MFTFSLKKAFLLLILLATLGLQSLAFATKGIYLTQYTLENTAYLNYLIRRSKASGIDTFIIDMQYPSKKYRANIDLVKQAGIKYVARVVMFPGGATAEMVGNPAIWQKKYSLVKQAIDYGADQIQLDYIRFNTKQRPSAENAKRILEVIKWYKTKVAAQGIPLQIDVFGEVSFGPSKWIGQNAQLFSQSIDTICPMVYPSHYKPYAHHYNNPYDTIYDSLERLKVQLKDADHVKIVPYIELSNYHYKMSKAQKIEYIKDQLDAVADAGVAGFYVWSAHNRYDNLFSILGG